MYLYLRYPLILIWKLKNFNKVIVPLARCQVARTFEDKHENYDKVVTMKPLILELTQDIFTSYDEPPSHSDGLPNDFKIETWKNYLYEARDFTVYELKNSLYPEKAVKQLFSVPSYVIVDLLNFRLSNRGSNLLNFFAWIIPILVGLLGQEIKEFFL